MPAILIYVNGTKETVSISSSGLNNNVNVDSAEPLLIGRRNLNGSLISYLNGGVNEVDIYNKELTQTDVDLLYASKVKRLPIQLSPVAYYPLDQGSDGTALSTTADFYKDLSGNGNHGTGVDADGDSLNVAESVLSYP